ncbi:MAG: hypothetical protein QXR45_10620 [Candidatus Bathyarchaeia archaeon]
MSLPKIKYRFSAYTNDAQYIWFTKRRWHIYEYFVQTTRFIGRF